MSIRRGTPSIGHDEYDRPYIHWDDDPAGDFVAHADHSAAIHEAVADGHMAGYLLGKRVGYDDGVRAAREAVAALEPRLEQDKRHGGYDCCGCSTTYDLYDDALAAIDAIRDRQDHA